MEKLKTAQGPAQISLARGPVLGYNRNSKLYKGKDALYASKTSPGAFAHKGVLFEGGV